MKTTLNKSIRINIGVAGIHAAYLIFLKSKGIDPYKIKSAKVICDMTFDVLKTRARGHGPKDNIKRSVCS